MSDVSRFLKETTISEWERRAADEDESDFKTIPTGFWDIQFF
jgi:hypothetical protein